MEMTVSIYFLTAQVKADGLYPDIFENVIFFFNQKFVNKIDLVSYIQKTYSHNQRDNKQGWCHGQNQRERGEST